MRRLFLLPLLLLAGCVEPNEQACSGFDLQELSKEQIEAVGVVCAKKPAVPAKVEAPEPVEKTLTQEISEGAAEAKMPVDRFMTTRAGEFIVAKHYAPLVAGTLMLVLIWTIVAMVLRYAVRTPTKLVERKTWRGTRFVPTEYKVQELDGWFVTFLIAMGAGYSAAVYFGVMA